MLVKDVMSGHVEYVTRGTKVEECARKMRQMDVGVLPVRENGKIIGVVTDRDICCRAVGDGQDPSRMTAQEIMTGAIGSCFEDDDCVDAAKVMKTKKLRRLAVMNHKEAMVGLLSVDDLARYSHDLAGEVLEAAAPWPH